MTVTMNWTIYALMEPIPLINAGAVRYVGFTTKPPGERLLGHMAACMCRAESNKEYDVRRNKWLRSVCRTGLDPVQIVLESGTWDGDAGAPEFRSIWATAERRWIAHYRAAGADLTNLTDGGDGTPGKRHSTETKAKIGAKNSVSQRGRKHSPETRAKMSESATRRQASPELRAAMSETLRKRVLSAEAIERISEGRWRGRAYTPEAIEKRAAKIRGRKATPETRVKQSVASLARMARPDELAAHRARLRTHKTVKLSIEKAREIRAAVAAGEKQSVVAARYATDSGTVCRIIQCKLWREV